MVKLNPKKDYIDETPQQTVGPYLTLGLLNTGEGHEEITNDLTRNGGKGEEIIVKGHLFDSQGEPLFNVMVEIWQANSKGVYNHPIDIDSEDFDSEFTGFGRDNTDEAGFYQFKTFKPGPLINSQHPDDSQAPHLVFIIHASGVGHPLYTRIYFEDEPLDDNFLNNIPQEKVETVIARKSDKPSPTTYHFDIVLKGEKEELVLESKESEEAPEELPTISSTVSTYFYEFS